jgi:hypothetical protein
MLDKRLQKIEILEEKIEDTEKRLSESIEKGNAEIKGLEKIANKTQGIVNANYQDIAQLRNSLVKLRETDEYKKVFEEKKPLISIRIATYNRAQKLIDNAIKSILKQTYQNFEVIIVGDHCTDDTEAKIKELNDPRIKFFNLYNRSIYPENNVKKWQVIGSLPMNIASSLASGDWIAPLDDDDEFSEDHLEVLLKHALQNKAELVYGVMTQKNLVDGNEIKIWADAPTEGNISLNGAIYMRLLNSIYQYDQYSWVMDEPGDWNLCRRMIESGVNISALDHPVGVLNMIPIGSDKKDY